MPICFPREMSVVVDGEVGRIWEKDGEDFEGVGGRETIIKIYTMKNIYFQ